MKVRTPLNILTLFFLSAIAIAIAIAVSGCGGGGGGSSSSQTLIPLTTSDIRVYNQGDTLTYNLVVRDTTTGETASGDVTVTVGGIVQNPFGVDCRSITYAGTLTGSSGTVAYSIKTLFYQDAGNSVYDCGEFDDTSGTYTFFTDTATSPNGIFLELKSPVQLGDITSGTVFYDDGTWYDCTNTVQAKENVSVPLGLYESYKIAQSCSFSDGSALVNTVWNVPDILGLKESGILDGFSLVFSAKSTNMN